MSTHTMARTAAAREGVQTEVTSSADQPPALTTGPRPAGTPATGAPSTGAARKALAVLRISTGFVFLWAFVDKLFGLSYSTTSAKAWIHGGSPTRGFLSSVDVGPLQGVYHAIAGAWWVDWLFMLGMLGVGLALILGVAMRPAAVVGALIMLMMWFGEFPLAIHTATGDPSGSTNPITDYHFIYGAVAIVLAFTAAGTTWGLGRIWNRLPYVRSHAWIR